MILYVVYIYISYCFQFKENFHSTNLLEKKGISLEKLVKKDVIKSEKFNIALVRLKKDLEIIPHPELYAIFFLVL